MVSTEPTRETDPASAARSQTLFWGLITTVVLAYFIGLVTLTWSDYKRTTTRAEVELEHFAELYVRAVDSSLSRANARMWALIDELSTALLQDAGRFEDQYGPLMDSAFETIQQVDSLVLIGMNGKVIWSTAKGLVGRNLGDRAYFQDAINLGVGEYTIGVPIISRATGQRLTPIAWPLLGIDGRPRGALASSLGDKYYSELLTVNGLEQDIHVEVVTSNGETAFVSGRAPRGPRTAVFRTRKEIPALDLYIDVTRNRSSVMSGYWQRTLVFGGIATILFVTVIGAAIRARAQSNQLAEALRNSERDRERIRVAQSEFNAIFENVGDGIVVYNDSNKLHRSNRKARKLLGVSSDLQAVKRLRSMLPPFSEMDADVEVQRVQLHTADKDQLAVQCRIMKLHLHGDYIAYGVLQDVSAEERLVAARTAFVTSVNHELRTPLTSLAGSLEILHERFRDALPKNAGKLLSMATRNADRLLVLVNDILTLQAIDQQQLSIQKERVSVAEVLSEAISANSGYGMNRDVKLGIHAAPEATDTPYIQADTIRLQQVFSNLISNAIKYTPPGGTVKIGAEVDEETVTFYVCDTGPGIPKTAHDRLFERFADPVHSREHQANGTGLGLAITRELVMRQDGEISFVTRSAEDGDLNSGTTFFVRFTRDEAAQNTEGEGE